MRGLRRILHGLHAISIVRHSTPTVIARRKITFERALDNIGLGEISRLVTAAAAHMLA
jgi:hypothetical protein